MKTSFQKFFQGFTLVEVLITVAVVGIFAAIAAPSFTTWLGNKKVDDITAQIEGAIREAQSAAVKKSRSCTLTIDANLLVSSTPADCLPSGPIDLKALEVGAFSSRSEVAISSTNLGNPPSLTFTFRGTITISGSGTGLITIYQPAGPSNRRKRCIAIANGIGIIRTGSYSGSDPSTPVDTSCATNLP